MGILSKFIKKSATSKADSTKVANETKKPAIKKAMAKVESPKIDSGVKVFNKAHRILIRPLVTEKSTELSNKSQYVFEVAPSANKIEVAKAIEVVYGVKPVKVNTVNVRGKIVSFGRFNGKRKNFKKAVVILPPDKKITVFEGV